MTTQINEKIAQQIIETLNLNFETHYGYQLTEDNEKIVSECVTAFINMTRNTSNLYTDCFTQGVVQSTVKLLFAGYSSVSNGAECESVENAALQHVLKATSLSEAI